MQNNNNKYNRVELVKRMNQAIQMYDDLARIYHEFGDFSNNLCEQLSLEEKKVVFNIIDHKWRFRQMINKIKSHLHVYKFNEQLDNIKAVESFNKDVRYFIKKHCPENFNLTETMIDFMTYAVLSEIQRDSLIKIRQYKYLKENTNLFDLDEYSDEVD